MPFRYASIFKQAKLEAGKDMQMGLDV